MIDLKINKKQLKRTVERAREKKIIMPTFEQMKNPKKIPAKIVKKLKKVGLWDFNPLNLFRITWKNEPKAKGGGFGEPNYIILPPELTGVDAKIVCLVGKWFPTGAHKVGATYGCLAPRLATGQFDPTYNLAVWPSTGNYCRGGAYNANLLACKSIAILPEEMSEERFKWLKKVAGEVIATPGCESNVKEIYDKCWELRADPKYKDHIVIFNQFDEFGNHLWHYEVTGNAFLDILNKVMKKGDRVAGCISQTGSAGTIAFGDLIKEHFPDAKIAAGEALQCPTLLRNGFGGHRIEGIGDKHVPWIHNVKNTDMIIATDDEDCMRLMRLFNEPNGQKFLEKQGVSKKLINQLNLMGISGIGNVLSAVKFAKYYELTKNDYVLTVLTDSMELYDSRMKEAQAAKKSYKEIDAAVDFHECMLGQKIDNTLELSYYEKLRVHNLKYYTWIEQQQRNSDELREQWYNPEYWTKIRGQVKQIDKLITQFNNMTGLLK